MSEYIVEPLPFDSQKKVPVLSEFIKTEINDSKFKSLIDHSKNQILLFEKNKKNDSEDILIKIYSQLTSGTISLKELNIVSSGIQRVFSSMYNNLFGKGNSKGPIQKGILDSSELILTDTSPGSFNLHVKRKENNPIIDAHDQNAVMYFSDLLEEISQENDYTEIVEEYGVRTFNVLRSWFDKLDREEVEFEFSDLYKNKVISLTKQKINAASKALNDIRTQEFSESLKINGELLAADSKSLTVTIKKNNNNEIKANTTAETFNKGLTIHEDYQFKLTKKLITNISTNQSKESYYLNDIKRFK